MTSTMSESTNNTQQDSHGEKKRSRRISMPTTIAEIKEDEAKHDPSDLHEEIVDDVANHLTLVPSLQTQWARWRLYRVAEETAEKDKQENLQMAITKWQEETQINAMTKNSSLSPSSSKFSRKAVRQLIKLRIQYGSEVDTARWRLSSWSWFAKQRSLRRKAVTFMARSIQRKQAIIFFTIWREETECEKKLRQFIIIKLKSRTSKFLHAWQKLSVKNLNMNICLAWLIQYKKLAKVRRCFLVWKYEALLTSMRTSFLFMYCSKSSARLSFHLNMFDVLRTWQRNVRYQSHIEKALVCLSSLRALRLQRKVLLQWHSEIYIQKSSKLSSTVKLLESELEEKCSMLVQKSKSMDNEMKVWDSERRSFEERMKSLQLTNDNLLKDLSMQKNAVSDSTVREQSLRDERERLRKEIVDMSAEKESLVEELDEAVKKSASFEQRLMKEETKVAINIEKYDNLVSEIDTLKARLKNEEAQNLVSSERAVELQYLLETEAKRNVNLVDSLRKAEETSRESDKKREDETSLLGHEIATLQEDLGQEAISRAAIVKEKESVEERLSHAMGEYSKLKHIIEENLKREQKTDDNLTKASQRIEEFQDALRRLENEKMELIKTNENVNVSNTKNNLYIRQLEETLKHSESLISDTKAKSESDDNKIKTLLVTVTELRETIGMLKSDLVLKDHLQDNVEGMKKHSEELRIAMKSKDALIDESMKEANSLKDALSHSESLVATLKRELVRHEEEEVASSRESEAEKEKLRAELSDMTTKYSDVKDEKIKLELQLHDVESKLSGMSDIVVKDETQLHELHSELVDVKQLLHSAESEMNAKAAECEKLGEEIGKITTSSEKFRQSELETKLELQNVLAEKAILEQGRQIEIGKMADLRKEYNNKIIELTTQQTLAEESKMRAEANAVSLSKVREKLLIEEKNHNELIAILSKEKDELLSEAQKHKNDCEAMKLELESYKASNSVSPTMMPSIISKMQQTIKEKNELIADLTNASTSSKEDSRQKANKKRESGGQSVRKKSLQDEEIEKALSQAKSISRDVKNLT